MTFPSLENSVHLALCTRESLLNFKSLKLSSFRSLTFEMLHDASQAVAVSSDQHPLPLFDLRNNLLVPEGQRSGDGVFQTLAAGELVLSQVSVAPVLQPKVLAVSTCGSHERECICLWGGATLLMVW